MVSQEHVSRLYTACTDECVYLYATLKDTIAQSIDLVMYHITKLQTNIANCKQCHCQSVQKYKYKYNKGLRSETGQPLDK